MTQIHIPFKPAFRPLILSGKKYRTSRTRQYGHTGDTFSVDGVQFRLTSVVRATLISVMNDLWESEGCGSPEHFERVWDEIHPKGLVPDQMVWVHTWNFAEAQE